MPALEPGDDLGGDNSRELEARWKRELRQLFNPEYTSVIRTDKKQPQVRSLFTVEPEKGAKLHTVAYEIDNNADEIQRLTLKGFFVRVLARFIEANIETDPRMVLERDVKRFTSSAASIGKELLADTKQIYLDETLQSIDAIDCLRGGMLGRLGCPIVSALICPGPLLAEQAVENSALVRCAPWHVWRSEPTTKLVQELNPVKIPLDQAVSYLISKTFDPVYVLDGNNIPKLVNAFQSGHRERLVVFTSNKTTLAWHVCLTVALGSPLDVPTLNATYTSRFLVLRETRPSRMFASAVPFLQFFATRLSITNTIILVKCMLETAFPGDLDQCDVSVYALHDRMNTSELVTSIKNSWSCKLPPQIELNIHPIYTNQAHASLALALLRNELYWDNDDLEWITKHRFRLAVQRGLTIARCNDTCWDLHKGKLSRTLFELASGIAGFHGVFRTINVNISLRWSNQYKMHDRQNDQPHRIGFFDDAETRYLAPMFEKITVLPRVEATKKLENELAFLAPTSITHNRVVVIGWQEAERSMFVIMAATRPFDDNRLQYHLILSDPDKRRDSEFELTPAWVCFGDNFDAFCEYVVNVVAPSMETNANRLPRDELLGLWKTSAHHVFATEFGVMRLEELGKKNSLLGYLGLGQTDADRERARRTSERQPSFSDKKENEDSQETVRPTAPLERKKQKRSTLRKPTPEPASTGKPGMSVEEFRKFRLQIEEQRNAKIRQKKEDNKVQQKKEGEELAELLQHNDNLVEERDQFYAQQQARENAEKEAKEAYRQREAEIEAHKAERAKKKAAEAAKEAKRKKADEKARQKAAKAEEKANQRAAKQAAKEAERKAAEEAERKAAEKAERKAAEEAERKATAKEARKREAAKKEAEKEAQLRKAAEEEKREEAKRKAAEEEEEEARKRKAIEKEKKEADAKKRAELAKKRQTATQVKENNPSTKKEKVKTEPGQGRSVGPSASSGYNGGEDYDGGNTGEYQEPGQGWPVGPSASSGYNRGASYNRENTREYQEPGAHTQNNESRPKKEWSAVRDKREKREAASPLLKQEYERPLPMPRDTEDPSDYERAFGEDMPIMIGSVVQRFGEKVARGAKTVIDQTVDIAKRARQIVASSPLSKKTGPSGANSIYKPITIGENESVSRLLSKKTGSSGANSI
jgi:hypothetical protein